MSVALPSLLIDGSVLEGGGQLLRNTVALSTLLATPVLIHKVRGNRKPPGLRSQHATGIKLAAEICRATITGADVGACRVDYRPGPAPIAGDYIADAVTAGSITLLLQISLPCLLFATSPTRTNPSTLSLIGGTNATQAPQVDYAQHILFPFCRKHFGLELDLEILKRGYYPRGGGRATCSVTPTHGPLPAVTLRERGAVSAVRGAIHIGGLPEQMARKMLSGACERLIEGGIDPALISIDARKENDQNVVGFGGGVVLWAETEGGCVIGGSAVSRKGMKPEVVGTSAAEELLKALGEGGCVDEYLQDQIIIFLALAKGKSTVLTGPLTLHTRTAIWVAEQLTDARFTTEALANGQVIITCEGIGYTARSYQE